MLDDSWDVPLSGDSRYFGSLILSSERFPSYNGSPTERLRALSEAVKSNGWRGLGGWVCAQQSKALVTPDDDAYWIERLRWMHDAGICYWKVDWVDRSGDAAWRMHLNELAAKHAPQLLIEHALAEESLQSAASYRTYDVENVICAPVTIDQIAHLLRAAPRQSPTIINCEDGPYIAAGSGSAVGVMRHPFVGPLPSGRQDFVFPTTARDLKRRLDDVIRCVKWHRLASPIPIGGDRFEIDSKELTDTWTLASDETYTAYHVGDRRTGRAPARIARGGMQLPEVEVPAGESPPFVLVTRSPNGTLAYRRLTPAIGRSRDWSW